jgi:hypothetical protein
MDKGDLRLLRLETERIHWVWFSGCQCAWSWVR